MPRFRPEPLIEFTTEVFEKIGNRPEDARIIADILVESDLRGMHSHGVMRIDTYVDRTEKGSIKAAPNIRIVQETETLTLMDGDTGLGMLSSYRAMEVTIAKAKKWGIGAVGVRNSAHYGMAAYYPMMALPEDMIGFTTTNAFGTMAPWGGITPTIGNNPFAVAIPAGKERPVVLDMATSVVARGKIMLAAQAGEPIPQSWALTKEGKTTSDAEEALRGLLRPIGDYKGFGTALVLDVLSGVLTGSAYARQVDGLVGGDPYRPLGTGHFFAALQIAPFTPLEEFKARMDDIIQQVKSTELAEGEERVYLPGEIEFEQKEEYLKEGILIVPGTLERLAGVADHLGLEVFW